MERAVFDRMAELDQHHWWFLARRRILRSLIERVVKPPKNARVLEMRGDVFPTILSGGIFHALPSLASDVAERLLEIAPRAETRVLDNEPAVAPGGPTRAAPPGNI